jgi:hypothetical protein
LVAQFYRRTDNEIAADLDDSYPGEASEKIKPESNWNLERVRDFQDFDLPVEYHGVPDIKNVPEGWPIDLLPTIDEIASKTSIAPHVREFIRSLFSGADPFEDLVSGVVAGDWEGLLQQSIGYKDIGFAFERIHENVMRGRYAIHEQWEGNAATAAVNWLDDYAAACHQHFEFMNAASWKIQNLAQAAYQHMVAINYLVDLLIDQIFNVLSIPGLIVAIWRGEDPLDILGSVFLTVTSISGVVDAIRAAVTALQGSIEQIAGNEELLVGEWPIRPYEHPEVN